MRFTMLKASIGLSIALFALAACGGAGSGPTAGTGDGGPASAPPVQGGASGGGASNLNLRIANLIAQTGVAGPGLDIYDDSLKPSQAGGSAPQPLVSNVAFGQVSAYFHPHVPADNGYIHLYALKAGQDPVKDVAEAGSFWVGANDTAQATIVLTYDGQGPLSSAPPLSEAGVISFSVYLEKGGGVSFSGDTAPLAPPPPAGDGMFLAADNWIPGNLTGSNYLMIDASCAPDLNGDPNDGNVPHIWASGSASVKSSFALFPAAAGSHHVSVVHYGTGSSPTCADLAPKQGDTTVDLTAGEEALTFVYGTGPTDLHLAIAPIAP